jgi:hypothetical protein
LPKKKCRPAMRARPPANGSATAGEAARGGGRLAHALPQAPGRRRRRAACKPSHLRRGPERRHGVGTHTDGGIGFSNFFFFLLSVCLSRAGTFVDHATRAMLSIYVSLRLKQRTKSTVCCRRATSISPDTSHSLQINRRIYDR